MATKSSLSYTERAARSSNPLVKKLFEIAEAKKSNITISADIRNTKDLLSLADPVFKTHINLVSDFSNATVEGLKHLPNTTFYSSKIESLSISGILILAGEGIVEAMEQTVQAADFPYKGDRALLILAEMTTKGSLATGDYTKSSVEIARKHKDFVIGFDEDFVIFTTGVNRSSKGDKLGQQYQTPTSAIERGADFIIAGRGIYAAEDPVASVKLYQTEGWEAYLTRIGIDY
ncbi:hypothetical protein V502_08199 [Pseudogymnoascus sp. VKM F-4520 (FW-2644)]|nr:hypothetical protein V502_08199 [Pseudogymnoascus sp. VKM F-4520 (FW-2644)]